MKKKLVTMTLLLSLTAGTLAGCGGSTEAPAEQEAAVTQESTEAEAPAESTESTEAAAEETTEAAEEEAVGMANPWVEVSEGEAKEACARLFKAPEGAEVKGWMICEELGDPDKNVGPMVQLDFTLDDLNYTARAQQGASEDADIAGNFVEWTVGPESTTLANWGGGNMPAETYRSINDSGYVDMITWYDVEIGIAYSLTVAAADLDGFDIQAIAEQMYAEENDPAADAPADFLQEQSGKVSFDSYDDVIAALTKGQGYAYIKLTGSDEDVLAVTDLVFEADHTATSVSIYNKVDGVIKQVGNVFGAGSSFPVRVEDGILYSGSNHSYETYFLSKEYGSLMMKDMISDGVDSGTNELSGFTRETNSFDQESADFTGTAEDLEKLLQERENKAVVEFTVIE